VHAKWEATHVRFFPDTWMLEWGAGAIPSTLVFALSDSFTSTNDMITVGRYLQVYSRMTLQSLLAGKV
jgi:hypothetical protein